MDNILLDGKTNFFEKRMAEYQKSGIMKGGIEEQQNFTTDAQF